MLHIEYIWRLFGTSTILCVPNPCIRSLCIVHGLPLPLSILHALLCHIHALCLQLWLPKPWLHKPWLPEPLLPKPWLPTPSCQSFIRCRPPAETQSSPPCRCDQRPSTMSPTAGLSGSYYQHVSSFACVCLLKLQIVGIHISCFPALCPNTTTVHEC